MADAWQDIDSTEYDSHCGDEGLTTPSDMLDGTDFWSHFTEHTHWLILDMSETYSIKKVHARSSQTADPIDTDVYVSDSKADWGAAVGTAWDFSNTASPSWDELDTTDKDGRYVKFEVIDTELYNWLQWGETDAKGLDVYGDVAAGGGVEHTHSTSDTMTISDSMSPVMTFNYAASDTMNISDDLAVAMAYVVSLTDTMTITDALSVLHNRPRRRKGRPYGVKPARVCKVGRVGI